MKNRTPLGAALLGMGAALVLTGSWTYAQDAASPDGGAPPRRIRRAMPAPDGDRDRPLLDALNLTADQRPKVEAEMKDFQAKMKALRDAHDKAVTALLTPEQAAQYAAMRQRGPGFGAPGGPGFGGPGGPGGRGGRGPGGPGGPQDPRQRVERMKSELNLTDAQAAKIGAILQDTQKQMDALRGSGGGDFEAMRAKFDALRQAQDQKINAVLNADQQAQWQAMRSQRRGPGGPGGRGFGGPGGPPPGGFDGPPPAE